MSTTEKKRYAKSEAAIQKLTPIQYKVTQQDATERPFQNEFWDHKEEGLYVDVVSGEPLFTSKDKFDSHCGWPSFTQPVEKERVTERTDRSLGMLRIEVRSKDGRVCAACKTKDCVTGNEKGYGCPIYEYPGGMKNNTNCKLVRASWPVSSPKSPTLSR